MIKTIIADDHLIVIESLLQTFEDSGENIEVVGTAQSGREVLDLLKKFTPDVVVLDISMPEMDGVETLQAIKATYPTIKVLMLTMHNDADRIKMTMQQGAKGYLLKNRTGKEVVQAIKTLMRGESYFPEDIQKIVFESHLPKKYLEDELKRMKLTDREEEVLALLAAGDRVKDIADKLCVVESTVDKYKRSIMDKIGARNVQDLVRFAVKNGYANDL